MILSLLFGCALPMSTLQTGRTVPPGQVEIDGAVGVNVSTAFIGSTVSTGRVLVDEAWESVEDGEPADLNAEEREDVYRFAFASSLFLPAPIQEGAFRVGVVRHFDLGLRMSTAGLGAETRYQFLDAREGDPLDLAVGLLLYRQSFDVPLPFPLSRLVDLGKTSRLDVSVPVAISRDFDEYGYVYGGARFQVSRLKLDLVQSITDLAGVDLAVESAPMFGAGAWAGGGVGYRYVFVFAEVDAIYMSWNPTVDGRNVAVRGIDFYPTFGLKLRSYDITKKKERL